MPKQLRLALIGFGNAAQAFARLLAEKENYLLGEHGTRVLITAIAGNSKGALLNPQGIDPLAVLASLRARPRFENALALDTLGVLDRAEADAAIELSPLSIADGQPAIGHIKAAFSRGMHVITANKGPIAWAFDGLNAEAGRRGLNFLYETTVMDGAPVFNLSRYCLQGCEVLSFEGVLNTTTNFILEEMGRGGTFGGAVAEAQRRGFAEADPTMDITGMDAAAKTCAIANVLMRAGLTPPEISTEGIENITARDIAEARDGGFAIKLLCRASRDGGRVCGTVKPERVPLSHPFAGVSGTSSALTVETDLMGRLTVIEHDPEIGQTAYGVYSDMLKLI